MAMDPLDRHYTAVPVAVPAEDEAAEAEEVGEDPVVEEDLEVAEGGEVEGSESEGESDESEADDRDKDPDYNLYQHGFVLIRKVIELHDKYIVYVIGAQCSQFVKRRLSNCEVVKPRVAAAEHISQFNEKACSPFVKKYKTSSFILEREPSQNSKIIATHTNSPDFQLSEYDMLIPSSHLGCRFPLECAGPLDYSVFLMTVRTGGGGTLQWSPAEANFVSKCNKL
ncbi:hypothetical protein F2Q69_00052144 [Brassica cretica]|uniref:Uncharacterized protein n=1 Tax=Brassica cretica TaxID=69181 RepID=A0A8S9N8G2_BRACR|nr:hypothetical protein F2Q69_00052144 [Brassica cretica]